jgi:hypothetical protein
MSRQHKVPAREFSVNEVVQTPRGTLAPKFIRSGAEITSRWIACVSDPAKEDPSPVLFENYISANIDRILLQSGSATK